MADRFVWREYCVGIVKNWGEVNFFCLYNKIMVFMRVCAFLIVSLFIYYYNYFVKLVYELSNGGCSCCRVSQK